MTTIHLVRHGEKEATDFDPVLTLRGHKQATYTGIFLKQFPLTEIIASPKIRTQQTANHISIETKIPVKTDQRLLERMDFGEGRHNDRNDFFTEWTFATNNRDFTPRAGTSSRMTGVRIRSVIDEINDPNAHVVIVTHGGAIADFLRNEFPEEQLKSLRFGFDEGSDFNVKECSITTLTKVGSTLSIKRLHQLEHLVSEK